MTPHEIFEKKLLPSPELCKLIPPGEFSKCCWGWLPVVNPKNGNKWDWESFMNGPRFSDCSYFLPAPTLQEILEVLPHDDAYNDLLLGYSSKVDKLTGWHIYYTGDRKRHCYDANPVNAALELYLKVNPVISKHKYKIMFFYDTGFEMHGGAHIGDDKKLLSELAYQDIIYTFKKNMYKKISPVFLANKILTLHQR